MKKILSFLLLVPIYILSQNQEKLDSLLYYIDNEDKIYTKVSEYCTIDSYSKYPQPPEDAMLFISGYSSCDKYGSGTSYFLKVMYGSYEYYYPVNFNNKVYRLNGEKTFVDYMDWYDELSEDDKELIKQEAKNLSEVLVLKEKKRLFEKLNRYENLGIAILEAVPTDNYSMTGAKFRIINFSNKTIKYITFNFYGINSVDDKVLYRRGTYNASRKGIGPVEKYDISEWSFDDVWLTDIVQTLELTSVNIQYTNGTSKTIKITKNHWLNEDIIDRYSELSKELDLK
ncbi:hypothetical protein [Riemerella columbina]|uniref:hypothetical protein n=1 Tax=Riemerella columbina TaxID=103810 RepID=UPI0003AAE655|nr:hypothetical protein [Riemerella columbina]